LLENEVSLDSVIANSPQAPPLQDDRPTNEYFMVRYLRSPVDSTSAKTANPESR
jgi:hypothetical protein